MDGDGRGDGDGSYGEYSDGTGVGEWYLNLDEYAGNGTSSLSGTLFSGAGGTDSTCKTDCSYVFVHDAYCWYDASCGSHEETDAACGEIIPDSYCKMDSTCNPHAKDGYCALDSTCNPHTVYDSNCGGIVYDSYCNYDSSCYSYVSGYYVRDSYCKGGGGHYVPGYYRHDSYCVKDSSCNPHHRDSYCARTAYDSYCVADGSCGGIVYDSYCIKDSNCSPHYRDAECTKIVYDSYCKYDSTCGGIIYDSYCIEDSDCGFHYADNNCNPHPVVISDSYCKYDAECGHYEKDTTNIPALGDISISLPGMAIEGYPVTISASCTNADHMWMWIYDPNGEVVCSFGNGSGTSISKTITPTVPGEYTVRVDARNTPN